MEVTGTLTTTDQRREFVREPDNPPNLVLDVEEPDAMTQAQWLETYRLYLTLDEREDELSIWDIIQPSTLRRSPRLLQQFNAAHAQAKSLPIPRNQGIQKSLIRFSNMVKWKVPNIKAESFDQLEKSMDNILNQSARLESSYAFQSREMQEMHEEWDIGDLLNLNSPE